ncbi:YesL family protein [Alkalihalobacillus sp. 1P02AB]|uniref:YesL family protein n=1 Tax=Alkalihalobacillus sp. 1P02AB TaxID=3132260 RepID=UPI0039A64D4D
MVWNGLMGSIYRLCDWIMFLAYINFLWIIFTILGGGIFGITPATSAMFAIIRKRLIRNDDTAIFKSYWIFYREVFIKMNILGLLMLITGTLIYLNYTLIEFQNFIVNILFFVIILLTISIYTIISLYIFPVFVHFELTIFEAVKNSFLIGILNPLRTVSMIFCLTAILILFNLLPGLLLLFSGSLIGILLMSFAFQSFNQVAKRKDKILSAKT